MPETRGIHEIDLTDTPADRVAHALDSSALRQSATAVLPRGNDLFHEAIPVDYISQVFAVMADFPQHTFQVLTKRPGRMASLLRQIQPEPLPNVWLGTSIETDRYVWRADRLRAAPAAVRFLSCEPLLGPLPGLELTGIDWVIVGGESGVGHRPIDPVWVRDLRDRCVQAGIPFFFKQWGGRTPKTGGRLLDDRTWDQYPTLVPV